MSDKKEIAYSLLQNNFPQKEFRFLGEGKSSSVFTDEIYVFKIFILDNFEALSYKQHTANTIKLSIDKFENSQFFYPILEIIEITDKRFILIYPFEKSEPCLFFRHNEIQDFLAECLQKRLIFQDIKPENFIRVNEKLKWIDYEPDKFTDNLFLNMACRAFIYAEYENATKTFLNKLCRSAINQFDLPELKNFQKFANDLFTIIIYKECNFQEFEKITISQISNSTEIKSEGNYVLPYNDKFNPETIFWKFLRKKLFLENITFDCPFIDKNNYFSPKHIVLDIKQVYTPQKQVSLVIKACVQDTEIIYEATKHIVRQLAYPNSFDEIILALDIRKNDFLREYNSENTWEKLIKEAQELVDDYVIDKFIFPNENDILKINEEWLGIKTNITHTIKKVPITSQLFAFENTKNDYILQVDCDVMIGRLSKEYSFLNDMIEECEKNEKVLSVGFNIYKGEKQIFTNYFGFENGGFVPEVRFCLLKKSRIKSILPLKNELVEIGFQLSWYRSLELMQKEKDFYSIRGGSSLSFFIHPQNFKKADKDTWFTTLDRIEQLQIPYKQINEFDLSGSYYDWTNPKRNENLVIISCFRNITLSRFLRYWYSLINQTHQDWGLILIDDASENGISLFIKSLIKPYQDKITFIQNHFRVGVAQNTYKAIHYFMQNTESIVCILDVDDALIGKNSLKNIYEKYTYWEADVVIGKMYRSDKIQPHYKYTPNFVNPRLYGGNVWQHLRSFKKYLFDSLDFNDLKIESEEQRTDNILLSRRFSQKMKFPEHCWDFAYMIPIVEMSENPMWINHFNIFHDRTTINTPEIKILKESIISKILAKPSKSTQDVIKGRKTFLPNLKKIEIDITYECNLKCINCNRSSTQAPIKEGMSIEQIQEFVRESIALNKKWELINLLGGEPTIHKDFLQIVDIILYEYIEKKSPETILQITSNGFGELVQQKLNLLPKHLNLIIDYASFKDDRIIPYFSPFNDAPIDNVKKNQNEYHKGCWVTSYCGIGLNQLGYYPCGVAGGIDRVFEFDLGVKSLKDVDESIVKLLDKFCRFCGNFSDYEQNKGNFIPRHEKSTLNKPIISESWKQAYKKYNGK